MKRRALPFVVGSIAFVAGLLVQQHGESDPDDEWGRPVHTTAAIAPNTGAASVVSVYTGCRILRPGSAPWDQHNAQSDEWRAATKQALVLMGLPAQHADEALRKISTGEIDDVIGMGRDGATAITSRQTYRATFSTTYMHSGRRVVCHDARYAFASPQRTEGAALYIVGDYHVAVFGICGNVSRVFPGPGPAVQGGPEAVSVNTVPEPGSLWLVAAGLIVLAFTRRT